jgi:hypothetical protein
MGLQKKVGVEEIWTNLGLEEDLFHLSFTAPLLSVAGTR